MTEPETPTASRISVALRQAFHVVRYLRTPESGLFGQGIRFLFAGGTVAIIYITTTTVLADVFGVPFQLALAIGFATGLVVHFLFQRYFVWVHHEEFSISAPNQVGRYLLIAAIQYGTTAAVTSLLPSPLHLPTTVVYIAWMIIISASNFLIFGHGIFHAARDKQQKSSRETSVTRRPTGI